jgi:predicted RNase H-like HicB family nuclease
LGIKLYELYELDKEIGFMKALTVKAIWDKKVSVWVATSEDVPGLVTEAATAEELEQKLQVMIPELLKANGSPCDQKGVPVNLLTERDFMAQ